MKNKRINIRSSIYAGLCASEKPPFYAWRRGKSNRLSTKKSELAQRVKEVFYLHRRRYGARRISAELKASGLVVGRRLAGSLMKAQTLTAIRPRTLVPKTTDSKHSLGFAANLLKDSDNKPSGKGQVIVGDITYLPLQNGKCCYFGNFSGQVHPKNHRLASLGSDDGAACH